MTREESFQKSFEAKRAALEYKKAAQRAAIDTLSAENEEFSLLGRKISVLGARLALTAISGDTKALGALRQEIDALSARRDALLKAAGIADITYDCPLCEDTGYINGKICDCIKNNAKAIMLSELSRDLPLDRCSFEDFDLKYYQNVEAEGGNPKKRMTGIFKLCKEYTIGFDPQKSESLLFMGNTGIGKTHLSLAIVKSLLAQGFNVIYGSAYNLFSEMESEHFGEHTNKRYEQAISCDLLVIDDLGSEFVSPFIQTLLYNIVNTRLLAHKPTIVNTNLTVAQIGERYSPRVASRFIGEYNMKLFLGNDIRQLKALDKSN
ncbi:MAG: ATP-binding protein [Clostridia bacterium]|nr:ATP-binding protein [Clostridia bacterium]